MGTDKALLDFHGMPQIEYVCDLLTQHCLRSFYPKEKNRKHTSVWLLSMIIRNSLITGDSRHFISHEKISLASWLVVACDLPLITDQTIFTLLKNRDPKKTATAFLSTKDALPEPLCAIWEGQAYHTILNIFMKYLLPPKDPDQQSPFLLNKPTRIGWIMSIRPKNFIKLLFNRPA